MSIASTINHQVTTIKQGEPFTPKQFLKLGSRASIDKALSRLEQKGLVERLSRGIYVRPKQSRFVGNVKPNITQIIKAVAESNGETIQVHGAEAARLFNLSTQMPTLPVFYTSGSSRVLTIGNLKVKLMHVAQRKLQCAGTYAGIALSALWYIGKNGINQSVVAAVCSKLEPIELNRLLNADVPAWMAAELNRYAKEIAVD